MGVNSPLAKLPSAVIKDVQHVLTALEPAVQAGIVQSNADTPGSYQFIHGLIRETIYEDLARGRSPAHARSGWRCAGRRSFRAP